MQSVTKDHFCSNYGTWKTQPTVTPDNWWAQSSFLTMSLVYSFFNNQEPETLCPEQGELPHRGSLTPTLQQRYTFLPHLSPLFANQQHIQKLLVSVSSFKSEHSQNVPDHLLTCLFEGKPIFRTSAVTLSSFQYMGKNSPASMQEHYGPCQTLQ